MAISRSLIDREAWLEERKTYLGATDVAALVKDVDGSPIHPYKTPHDVWLEKRGLAVTEENERMTMGLLLEPVVALRFKIAHPDLMLRRTKTIRHPRIAHFACNPDRLIAQRVEQVAGTQQVRAAKAGLKAVFQIKSSGYFGGQEFGASGTDEVPDWYLMQCQWELFVTGRELAVLGHLTDTHLYREFLIYRDEQIIEHLKSVADHFWQAHIKEGIEPEVTGHKKDTEWLNRAWEPKPDSVYEASDKEHELIEKYITHLERKDRLDTVIEGFKNGIKHIMGDAAVLKTDWGDITWKADKNGVRRFVTSGLHVPSPKADLTTKEMAKTA